MEHRVIVNCARRQPVPVPRLSLLPIPRRYTEQCGVAHISILEVLASYLGPNTKYD
jgi:hypothetical protein